ncbi:apolipoprotein acyltransferase [Shimia thalassica]|jgi:uncharacterized membrane protein YgdD (TMEM256/DUF423 family)|uniref:Apolipoprotein acyltransferase n=1 Tax=Shimia thalassica TaxID=1715693 RepID=A0A0P1I950_9RHOB|nr:apolipoprotein acyltransferase [Shimia thalassica]PHO02574.1 apolipoprotein acyltransferase [Rhodobacteraceae bacterium 4F10]MBU2944263.1 apolipoprotein acyltransferase [Shimia thalassica]MDO6479881.1 apolipoprotein acyltransferase [Shimia thalassica]MDO6483140.1 apolipoprotein acyltransferase [Shimia thalassica]MDO6504949.1 apolipoprotein acyltransferase [Shimia thalassica]
MIVIFSALFGALLGTLFAKRRKGKRLDILQYAAAYAMAFAILGLFVTLIVHRISV